MMDPSFKLGPFACLKQKRIIEKTQDHQEPRAAVIESRCGKPAWRSREY